MRKMVLLFLVLSLMTTSALAWSCPGCGSEAEHNFCGVCGTKKPANFCPNCGADHTGLSYTFCPNCGARLGAPAGQTVTQPPVVTAPPVGQGNTLVPAVLPMVPAGAKVISISPDGEAVICMVDGEPAVVRSGRTIWIMSSDSRGVQDVHGNLAAIARMLMPQGSEGVAWSPDGRYAALTNNQQVVENLNLRYDPIVLDTVTGELFLLATTGTKMANGDASAVLTAAFSADSRTLYTSEYGNTNGDEGRYSLVAYDLETLEAATILAHARSNYYPHLVQLSDGSFVLLYLPSEREEPAGLNYISKVGNRWSISTLLLDVPNAICMPKDMQHSSESGWALLRCLNPASQQEGAEINHQLIRLRLEEDFSGLDEYWVVSGLDAPYMTMLTGAQLQSGMDQGSANVVNMAVSSDGQQALLLCKDGASGECALLLLEVNTMALKRLHGIDESTLQVLCKQSTTGCYMAWQGNLVLIGPDTMQAQAYYLQ